MLPLPRIQLISMLACLGFFPLHAIADSNSLQQSIQTQSTLLQSNAVTAVNDLQALQATDIAAQVQTPTQANFDPYPIESTLMTPGIVQPILMNLTQLVQPIFLVGADSLSTNWLKQNIAKLTALRAIGFLVHADSEADLTAFKQIAGSLPIVPLNADQFAKQWNLNHYPVLITAQGITQ